MQLLLRISMFCLALSLASCGASAKKQKVMESSSEKESSAQNVCQDRSKQVFNEDFFAALSVTPIESGLSLGDTPSSGSEICAFDYTLSIDSLKFKTIGLQTYPNYIGLGDSAACKLSITVNKAENWQFALIGSELSFSANISENRQAKITLEQVKADQSLILFEERLEGGVLLSKQYNQQSLNQEAWMWSDCLSKETISLELRAEIHPSLLPVGPDAWELALEEKLNNSLVNGSISIGEALSSSQVVLPIKWRKCS